MPACLVRRRLAASSITDASIATSSFRLASTCTNKAAFSRNSRPGRHTQGKVHLPSHPGCAQTRKYATVSSATVRASPDAEVPATRHQALTLLAKTLSVLPRTLPTDEGAVGPESSAFWCDILDRAGVELGSGSVRAPAKATITVCGFDERAGSNELVTALLEDPFSVDPTYSDILRNRWSNDPSSVDIEHGKPAAYSGRLTSPSTWLQQFSHDVQLSELPDLTSLSAISTEADSLLLSSDVLVLLCDPLTTSLSDLTSRARHLLNRPNTVLVLTSAFFSEDHHGSVSETLSKLGCNPARILFVDHKRALDAITLLQANPGSPSAIDRYSADTLSSRISTIGTAVGEVLRLRDTSDTSLLGLRTQTALAQVYSALAASFRSVEDAENEIIRVVGSLEELRAEVQQIRQRTEAEVLGKEDRVGKALVQSAKEMKELLDSLPFWKMLWRVDEIGAQALPYLAHTRPRIYHDITLLQLILQTGRLEPLQNKHTASAFTLLASPSSNSALRSPVLVNRLHQLAHSPSYALTPTTLTHPIHSRRTQLTLYTTTKLHREAQSAVLGAFGGVLSGAGLGWWMAFGEHILSFSAGAEAGTAVGAGALLAVGSVRWAVGKWERAKRRWMQDAERVGEGVRRDLKATIQRTVDERVVVVASTACEGLQDLVGKRKEEIHQIYHELKSLETELSGCARFPSSWTGNTTSHPDLADIDSK
ncbi:hypothetical protein HYDPIDRAFT_25255 [Hydnomerulius pinastri MD-312]|nr:hypothetical protein HYDPIDRAFT_25255 [Hydnomerulius pinastri MD-312]